jgi:hypothetical protein
MSTKKTANKKNPNNPVQVLKEANCKSLEGSATLTYQIGIDDDGAILSNQWGPPLCLLSGSSSYHPDRHGLG